MTSSRQSGKRRRIAVVLASTVGLSALTGVYLAGSASADTAAARAAYQTPLVPGTPCTTTAKSCVDLESQKAWLFKDGKIMRGPVAIASGGNGQETPVGHSLRVYRKEKDHKSLESRLPNGQPAPMPNSVFFEDGGIAFHGGDPRRSSAGCIHLGVADSQAWFDYLQVGDQVQVVKGSEELAARRAAAGGSTSDKGNKDKSKSDDSKNDDESDDD
jgi:lipoprotein-anchoring transpeptidase ErfK/SrfK